MYPHLIARHSFLKSKWLVGLILAVLSFSIFSYIQSLNANIIGVDGYYHIRLAHEMRSRFIIDRLPQAKLTLFAEHFSDKEFLFHVFQMPFAGNDLNAGAKWSAVTLNIAMILSLFFILGNDRPLYSLFYFAIFFSLSTRFFYQILLPRSHLMSIIWVLLGVDSFVRKRHRALGFFCFLQTLSYTAWHLLPGLIGLLTLFQGLSEKKWQRNLFGFSLLGTAIGLLIHPHPLVHLRIWFYQNILFFYHRFFSGLDISRGSEFFSPNFMRMTQLFPTELLIMGIGLATACIFIKKLPLSYQSWGFVCFVFFLMTRGSIKFCHYWSPCCFIWGFLILSIWLKSLLETKVRFIKTAIIAALVLFLFSVGFQTNRNFNRFQNLKRFTPNYDQSTLLDFQRVLPMGAFLFSCDWMTSPEIYFFRPDLLQAIILDPIFAYYGNREQYTAWKNICDAEFDRPPSDMFKSLGAQYVLLPKSDQKRAALYLKDRNLEEKVTMGPFHIFQVL